MSLSDSAKAEIVEIASMAHNNKSAFFNEIEFKKDLYAVFIIKKMVARFLRTGNINDKLITNNIIISFNAFDPIHANKIFRLALTDAEYAVVKSFLVFLDLFISHEDTVPSNQVIDDLLHDTALRFKLRHKYE